MVTIDVMQVVGDDEVALVLLAKTGICYTAQCGGMMCSHPEVEGFIVSLGRTFGDEIDDCKYGCQYLSYKEEGKEMRERLAHDLSVYLKEKTKHWTLKIEFDFDRIDKLEEGWWPVKVKGTFNEFYDTEFNHKGFIHTGNCD